MPLPVPLSCTVWMHLERHDPRTCRYVRTHAQNWRLHPSLASLSFALISRALIPRSVRGEACDRMAHRAPMVDPLHVRQWTWHALPARAPLTSSLRTVRFRLQPPAFIPGACWRIQAAWRRVVPQPCPESAGGAAGGARPGLRPPPEMVHVPPTPSRTHVVRPRADRVAQEIEVPAMWRMRARVHVALVCLCACVCACGACACPRACACPCACPWAWACACADACACA